MALSAKELAAELLNFNDLKAPTQLFVKAWKRHVFLLDPTADTRDEWEMFCHSNQGKKASWRAKLAQLLLCDPTGVRLFPDDSDVAKLGKKKAQAMNEIWLAGQKLLTVTDAEIEELEKN